MEHRAQVRGREVHATVRGVARRRDRRRVRRPHRRRAAGEREQLRRDAQRARQHVATHAGKAQAAERAQIGPERRRQERLSDAQLGQEARLLEPLERGAAWIPACPRLQRARQVAVAEPSVVVRRTDEAVEVVLAHADRPKYPRIAGVLTRPRGDPRLGAVSSRSRSAWFAQRRSELGADPGAGQARAARRPARQSFAHGAVHRLARGPRRAHAGRAVLRAGRRTRQLCRGQAAGASLRAGAGRCGRAAGRCRGADRLAIRPPTSS